MWIHQLIPKINFFWWTSIHGKILTIDNLVKRGFQFPNWCTLCRREEETIYHLFIHYHFDAQVWKNVLQRLNISWVFDRDIHQFILNLKFPSNHLLIKLLWKLIPPHICWCLWKERNDRIFREIENNVEGLLTILNKLLLDNISTCKWKTPSNPLTVWDRSIANIWNFPREFQRFDNFKKIIRKHTRWRTPKPPWVKLNFDGLLGEGQQLEEVLSGIILTAWWLPMLRD